MNSLIPFEIILNPITLIVLGLYVALFLWEALLPSRPLHNPNNRKFTGILFFIAFFILSCCLPLLLEFWPGDLHLIDLSSAGTIPAILLALVIYQILKYLYNLTSYHITFWDSHDNLNTRTGVIDLYSAFIFSPFHIIGNVWAGSIGCIWILGISPLATTNTILVITLLNIFQYANIKTPLWLGYLVQRPETRALRQEYGNRYNFADLPVLDLIFGTFNKPETYQSTKKTYKEVRHLTFIKDSLKSRKSDSRKSSLKGMDDTFFYERDLR